jgi:hypothetical protein
MTQLFQRHTKSRQSIALRALLFAAWLFLFFLIGTIRVVTCDLGRLVTAQ